MSTKYHSKQFPPKMAIDKEMQSLISEARTELGRYDGFLSSMSNSEILLSPLFVQEAVLSSKIEGTQSTLTEVLEFEGLEGKQKELTEDKRNDLNEVLNYRNALSYATNLIKELPLSQRVFKETHKELMKGVRGENKAPGVYRKIPVWIGPDKSSIETARFIPIEAAYIEKAMSDFEIYLHDSDEYDDLIKVAILHAEFEAIHPFLDGNGRLGRMLIPLYLSDKNIISSPSFYISNYFEKNRDDYYDLLLGVSKYDDWSSWCKYFIKGVIEQAKDNLSRAKKIVNYFNELKNQLPTLTKSQYGITALDYLFKNSYFSSLQFYKNTTIPKPTAIRLLRAFEEKEILYCKHGKGSKPNFYIFRNLINIADGK